MEKEAVAIKIDVLNTEKLQGIIAVLRHWAEDERIPEDARQKMLAALNDAMTSTEKTEKIFFECDRRSCPVCNKRCKGRCQHTNDIRHAQNFERVGRSYREKPRGQEA